MIEPSGVVKVAAKGSHSLYVKIDGELWAMGSNSNGQNGDGTTVNRSNPVMIRDSGVNGIAAGASHSLFINKDGSLWSMGRNSSGQLGDGTFDDRHEPIQVLGKGVIFAEARASHSHFIKEDGSLWSMGNNSKGQLGDGTIENRSEPVRAMESGVVDVVCGVSHSLFITKDGFLWGMGKNTSGELGDGTNINRSIPVKAMLSTTTFQLVNGEGDTHNSMFTIDGTKLKTAGNFDFEEENEYSIRVVATDPDGLEFEKTLTIYVTDVNEAPFPPSLSSNSVPENSRAVSMVGKFTTGDPDGDKVSLTMATDDEGLDNELFDLKGTTLNTNSAFDYETRAKLLIRVIATDPNGLSSPQEFEIIVVDVNEPPLALTLDNNTLEENTPKDTLVGTLSTEDSDTSDTFTYSFAKGEGDTDNPLFQLDKATGAITSNNPLDHEAKSLHSIRVSTTDGDGHTLTEAFAIYVVNVNEPPLTLEIDNAVVRERKAAGTLVGKFSTTDTDASDTHEYALVSGQGGTHNEYFQIDGDELKTSMEIDGKTIPEASILIRIMDAGGLT